MTPFVGRLAEGNLHKYDMEFSRYWIFDQLADSLKHVNRCPVMTSRKAGYWTETTVKRLMRLLSRGSQVRVLVGALVSRYPARESVRTATALVARIYINTT